MESDEYWNVCMFDLPNIWLSSYWKIVKLIDIGVTTYISLFWSRWQLHWNDSLCVRLIFVVQLATHVTNCSIFIYYKNVLYSLIIVLILQQQSAGVFKFSNAYWCFWWWCNTLVKHSHVHIRLLTNWIYTLIV